MAKGNKKIIVNNKKARHDYFIEDTFEAGLVLTGTEIKSIRNGKVSIKESYARIEKGELLIYGMHISPYEQGNIFNVDPLRPRKLLLHKKEINKIMGQIKLNGLTLIPLNIYINENGIAKMELALARGKKLYDKRETLAKKDSDRKMERAMKKNI
ncbi:MAG TPA: SsrA-binding protein SmpB [Anaerovoracaceae bacterium]|nr:SsrA-binding protein SmpB [Anaerovoracaceae bacterium]